MNNVSFSLIGAGKVGIPLAFLLKKHINLDLVILNSDKNIEISNYWLNSNISFDIKDIKSDIILVSVKDTQIESLFECLKSIDLSGKLLINTSGTILSSVLKTDNNYSISLHPMMSFTDDIELSIKKIESHYFTVEGDDNSISIATPILNYITKNYQIIKKDEKMLYHIASIFANNYIHAVMDIALKLIPNGDIKSVIPLLEDATENIKNSETPLQNLTGPVSRGDFSIVEKHINFLKNNTFKDISNIYEVIANYLKASKFSDFK
ncbi:DUF2520 domain-containing protein [bacterium]|nr:DUF2520 domain-containing protein [bacterium]